jgi:ABC-type transporter Mla subunit MlaD
LSRNVSPFKLGLLILVCGSLGLITIIWVGASHYFEKRETYVSYFDESVKGLQKDAAVNYRGVAVGRVADIRLAPDGRLIEVLMDLRPDFKVDKSLSIQLRQQGLTGLSYLEIDSAQDNLKELTPSIDFPLHHPLIPSYPSEIKQLKSALEVLYGKVYAIDVESLSRNLNRTFELVGVVLQKVDQGIEPADWRDAVNAVRKAADDTSLFMERLGSASSGEGMAEGFKDLSATLKATRQASENLAKQLKDLPPGSLANLAKSLDKTLATGGAVFTGLDRRIDDSAAVLQQSLQQLNLLLGQLSALVQNLREQPNRILFPSNPPNPFERK